ncbi:MAG: hypothetical protein IT436_03855 [Phycisphaerales bacterium]|nr:hypothetical protein [Phycisphaerales bacterium]
MQKQLVLLPLVVLAAGSARADVVPAFSVTPFTLHNGDPVPVPQTLAAPGAIAWRTDVENVYPQNVSVGDRQVLDWADVASGTQVSGFDIAYFTDSTTPVTLNVRFYSPDDGSRSPSTLVSAFTLPNLPGRGGHKVSIDLREMFGFTIAGSDLDGDDLTDFAYSISFVDAGTGSFYGPLFSSGGPGATAEYDLYAGPKDSGGAYDGTFTYPAFPGIDTPQEFLRIYSPVPAPGAVTLAALGALTGLSRRTRR